MSEIPALWSKVRLDEVIQEFIVPMRDKPPSWSGDIPWCRIEDFEGKYLNGSKSHQYVDAETVRRMNLKVFPSGTLLCSCSATLGICTITAKPLVSNQTFIGLVPKQGVSTDFLYYKMTSHADTLQGMSSGTTIAYLPRSKFEAFEIELPPPPQQRRIAEILSTIDDAIEQTEALIAKYQNIKAGLMHDLFTRGVTPDGHLRPARDRAPQLYKESPLGWIPKDWDITPIAVAFDIQLGKMLNKLAKSGKWNAPYLGNRAVQWDFVDCTAIEEMDFNPSERERFSLKPGDLLVCEGGDVGRTAMWKGEIENCFYQKAIHRLRPKSRGVLPMYMLRFMRFARDNGLFREFTSQSSIAHLTQEKLGAIPMLLPKAVEQKMIADRFDVSDELLLSEGTNRAKFQQEKLGLMYDLLTGRVRLNTDLS